MATKNKPAAKSAPTKKPAAPVVAVKSDAEDATTYRATGRIWHNGQLLRPAAPGREADTVELTDREAFGLRGFVEPVETETSDPPTE